MPFAQSDGSYGGRVIISVLSVRLPTFLYDVSKTDAANHQT